LESNFVPLLKHTGGGKETKADAQMASMPPPGGNATMMINDQQ
jgi:hypothetical protein